MRAILTEPDKANGQCRCRNFESGIVVLNLYPEYRNKIRTRTLETVSESGMPMAPMKMSVTEIRASALVLGKQCMPIFDHGTTKDPERQAS